MPGFVAGVWEGGGDLRRYKIFAEHWYYVWSAWILEYVILVKDLCCIRVSVRL